MRRPLNFECLERRIALDGDDTGMTPSAPPPGQYTPDPTGTVDPNWDWTQTILNLPPDTVATPVDSTPPFEGGTPYPGGVPPTPDTGLYPAQGGVPQELDQQTLDMILGPQAPDDAAADDVPDVDMNETGG